MNTLVRISDLYVRPRSSDQQILKGISLSIAPGTHHAMMGANGSGKSTLAQTIAGNPTLVVEKGSILFNNIDLISLKPEERALLGAHVVSQYPPAIPGVSIARFLHLAVTARQKATGEQSSSFSEFIKILKPAMTQVGLPWEAASKGLHEGFSGGEKKRIELLELILLTPTFIVLDEIDSGMDMDAQKFVVDTVDYLRNRNKSTAILTISHYPELLKRLKPDYVHVLKDGIVTKSGSGALLPSLTSLT